MEEDTVDLVLSIGELLHLILSHLPALHLLSYNPPPLCSPFSFLLWLGQHLRGSAGLVCKKWYSLAQPLLQLRQRQMPGFVEPDQLDCIIASLLAQAALNPDCFSPANTAASQPTVVLPNIISRSQLTEDEILMLCNKSQELLLAQPVFLHINPPVVVVGNILGTFFIP